MATRLIGTPFGEVDNHFWMLWVGLRASPPVSNLPTGFDLPLMDPVNLLFALPGSLFGPIFAYNLVIVGNVALAALGGYALARELTGSAGAALVGLTATASAPFLGGMIEFGITEALPIGWLALHATLLLRFGRTGAPLDALGAGAALGALLLSGWYHAAFALVAEVGLGAWALARGRSVRTLAGIVLQGAVAAMPLGPLWRETEARAAIWAPRLSGLTRPAEYVDWAKNPRFGTDLLNLVLPHLDALPVARTVYVGLVVLTLALLAGTRRRGLAAFVLAVPLYVLTLGHWLRIGGEAVGGMGPLPAGWLVETTPLARGISHWYRAAGPASIFLAAAAAVGASLLLRRSRRPRLWGALLSATVLVDAVALAPTAWPRPSYAPDPPAALLDLPDPGGLLQLPFDEGQGLTGIASRRVYDQWQVFHGRAISEHYEGRDALLYSNATVAAWQRSCVSRAPLVPSRQGAAADLAALVQSGVAYVVAHPAYATRRGCVPAIERQLGAPIVRSPAAVVWRLADAPGL